MSDFRTARSQYFPEIEQNPKLKEALFALTHAEVGGQGPQAQQAFMESVFNRAAARKKTLADTIYDRAYFPKITHDRMARGIPPNVAPNYTNIYQQVADGSNVGNWATGNASGTVRFNGGPETFAANGERFGVEGPDRKWAESLGFGTSNGLPKLSPLAPDGSNAGVANAQPMPQQQTTQPGAQPQMASPYSGPSPDDVAMQRKIAMALMGQATSTEPVGHWTQALARVIQGGVGGMNQDAAKAGEQQGTASVVDMLGNQKTPTAAQLISNPWTKDVGMKSLAQQVGGSEWGKQGTIVQGGDGKFYAVQFSNKAETKYHPLQAPGGGAVTGAMNETGGVMSAPTPLQPSKGTEKIGGVLRDKATGRPIANVEEDIAGGKKAEKIGTEQGDFVARFPKIESALSGWERQADNTDKIIERAKRSVQAGGQRVAGWGGVLSNVPSTDARKLRNDLETIKANIGFDKLQAMREASPTGGALGAISDMENKLLQAVQGALDQMDDPASLAANLSSIQSMLKELKIERRAAFKADVERFGGSAKPQGTAPAGAIPTPQPRRRKFNPATGELE